MDCLPRHKVVGGLVVGCEIVETWGGQGDTNTKRKREHQTVNSWTNTNWWNKKAHNLIQRINLRSKNLIN